MTRAIFFYIASLLLIAPFVLSAGQLSISDQLVICTPFLLLFGIPHGAIDNILFLRNKQLSNFGFIAIYLAFVGLNALLWVFLPTMAYLLFLLLSAFHFGQSQFSHYFTRQPFHSKLLYFLWGIAVLTGMVYLNIAEIHQIMSLYSEFAVFAPLHGERAMLILFVASLIGTLVLIGLLYIRGILKTETVLMELSVLVLILVCFYLTPLLIGFTFYFAILHSFKVLREEFGFLREEQEVDSILGFVKMVTPFTFFSIAGIGLLFGLIYLEILTISYGYCLLIVVSSITLPHVFVMNRFYGSLFQSNFYRRFA